MTAKEWGVFVYRAGKKGTSLAGLGRNKGTWDSSHSRRTAQRFAKNLREAEKDASVEYRVENLYG